METETVGRVLTAATIENIEDLWEVKRGLRPADQARRIELSDALVDTGASGLSLPIQLIQQLGLTPVSTRQVMPAAGPREATRYEAVRLTIQDRTVTVDVMDLPDGVPALIGQIPLEFLDLVVDPKHRRLIGNPEHGGVQIYEQY